MVLLAAGYIMKPELAMRVADKLGMNPADNDMFAARVFLNRYTRSRNPNFPMIQLINYAPFKPGKTFAFILPSKYADDNRNRKFKERSTDLKIKYIFMKLGDVEESEIQWDTVYRWWRD